MAKVVYKSYNRNEGNLFPVYLSDMVPAEHPARVVDAVVEGLDLSALERTYKGGGTSSYSPRAMLKVVFYAYLSNIYSGRQIARMWRENIIYMWLGGTLIPDFRTINNFRSRRLVGTFEGLFTQVVELLVEEGLVTLDVQYIDGTKIESCANKYTFVWKRATETNKAKLEKNVKAVLEEVEKILDIEQREAENEHPMTADEMQQRTDRVLERMKERKEALTKQQKKAVEKIADEDYYVCPRGQHLEHIGDEQSTSELGYVSTISKYRAQNCAECPFRGMCHKAKGNRVIEVNHKADEYRAKAKERLTNEEGLYHRSMRPIEPEAVFGDIKYDHGFKRFRLRGMAKVNVEFGLVALAHNLRKYARMQTLEQPITSEPAVAELPKTHGKVAA